MIKRSYHQYCALAKALDVVGERWTLLILRELITGPKRYKDLVGALPGMGTNLLATRLKELEESRLLERRPLSTHAGVFVYQLAYRGKKLGPALQELARWGFALLGQAEHDETFRPHWAISFLYGAFDAKAAEGLNETYQFIVGPETIQIQVHGKKMNVLQEAAPKPDLTFTLEEQTLIEIIGRQLTFSAALDRKKIQTIGDTPVLQHFFKIFGTRPGEEKNSWVTLG